MKNKIFIVIIICLLETLSLKASTEYGLYFKSHSFGGTERTILDLNSGVPFRVQKELAVDFQMMLRNEPDYGLILNFQTNNNQKIHLMLAAGENNVNFPAIVMDEGIFPMYSSLRKNEWIPVSVRFRIDENKIDLYYDRRDTTIIVPLAGTSSLTASFGYCDGFSYEIAPMNVRDVKVTCDGDSIAHWRLNRHNDTLCLDELNHLQAVSKNAIWLIDSHIEWKSIYSKRSDEQVDVVFNARDCLFYIIKEKGFVTLNPTTGEEIQSPIMRGYPAMPYPEHMVYDTLRNRVFSYSLNNHLSSNLNIANGRWSLEEHTNYVPRYYNHARTFNPSDSCFYFFGGYGFYQYRNRLFRLDVVNGQVSEV